jgi:signal transduction histidine kinase
MFGQARWRLTVWFAGVLALILGITGGAVFLTTRAVLFDQVDDDLRARAGREQAPLVTRILEGVRRGGNLAVAVGPAFTAGGYFYALVEEDGSIIGSTPNTDPQGLPAPEDILSAVGEGPSFAVTSSSEGDHLRVLMVPLETPRGRQFVLEVGRSTEPERQALRRLLLVLVAGGGVGMVLALGAGFFLAGWALRPIQITMDRQRAFVADASHELRTPLAIIRANAEILKRESAKPVQTNIASVDDVIQETDRLSSLVGRMLTLARADAGEAPTEMTAMRLSELADDTVRQMRLLAAPKQITIDLHPDGVAMVSGDELRLREMLTILLDNSIKYSDDGATVRVDVRDANGRVVLQVSDSGRGIPAEALPRIFDRFYRADKSRSREMGGAGLGLAIAKWIVNSHGGTISIESTLGQGTTVRVELPVA